MIHLTRHTHYFAIDRRLPSACLHLGLLIALLTGLISSVRAQSAAANPDRGVRSANSYTVSDLENISLTNGNLTLPIPLASLPPVAGGKLSASIQAVCNTKLWNTVRSEIQPDPVDPASRYIVSSL